MRTEAEHNAEVNTLSCLLQDPTLLHSSTLQTEMFGSIHHQRIFSSITSLGDGADIVLVAEHIEKEYKEAPMRVLQDVAQAPASTSNFSSYARVVERTWYREHVRSCGVELQKDPGQLENILRKLTTTGTNERWTHTPESAIAKADATIELLRQGKVGVKTNFKKLNRMIQNLMPGRLTVVGGRPAMGKTSFVCSLMVELGVPVGMISSEMAIDQIVMRLLSSLSCVSLQQAYRGMDEEEQKRWQSAREYFRTSSIYINEQPSITMDEIHAEARKWRYRDGIQVLIIDYLQRLGKDRNLDRTGNLRIQVETAKEIARQLDIHVILLSQVNRDVERRDDKRPIMSDYDGASTIEAEADHALMLYRPSVYDHGVDPESAELLLVKNRHGPIGIVHTKYDANTLTFTEADDVDAPF